MEPEQNASPATPAGAYNTPHLCGYDGRRDPGADRVLGWLLRLWDLNTGTCLHTLRGHRGIVYACALSEDARLAVSGSEDMIVRLWSLDRGELLFTFATSSAVTSCDISWDDSMVVAAEASGRIHVLVIGGWTVNNHEHAW